ncbi:MAG TPA: sulfatase-like hydrolase/transferase, partial [Thermoanaerobaculia bacterium]
TAAFLSNMCDANHQGWDDFACTGGRDGKTVANTLDWAAGRGDAKPFFLWVHLFGAHGPYYNGGDLAAQKLDPGYEGLLGPKRWRLDRVMTQKVPLSAADRRHLEALYDAAVLGSDHLAGNLLDGLKQAGRLDRTLLVVASDHGEELYAHNGYLYHSCSVYQTALHVPLGFIAPGLLPAGARVQQTVELIDVTPTILDLLGVRAPPLHGRSLVPYLERPERGGAGKPAFSQYGATTVHTALLGDFKLIDNPDGVDPDCIPNAPPHHYPIGRTELYDLAHDPGEIENLADRRPAQVADLKHLIHQRFAGLGTRARKQEVPDEVKKKLINLGYVAN